MKKLREEGPNGFVKICRRLKQRGLYELCSAIWMANINRWILFPTDSMTGFKKVVSEFKSDRFTIPEK